MQSVAARPRRHRRLHLSENCPTATEDNAAEADPHDRCSPSRLKASRPRDEITGGSIQPQTGGYLRCSNWELWQLAAGGASRRRQMHVGVGRRRPRRAACGRSLPNTAQVAMVANLNADPPLLCQGCERALMATGPWPREEDWVRPPLLMREAIYVGSYVEAWRLNELTWRRVIALAQGQRQTRAAIGNVLDALAKARDDDSREHVYRALGGATMHMWAFAVVDGWWPPAGKEPVDDQASPAWWLAWALAGFERPDPAALTT